MPTTTSKPEGKNMKKGKRGVVPKGYGDWEGEGETCRYCWGTKKSYGTTVGSKGGRGKQENGKNSKPWWGSRAPVIKKKKRK